MTLLNALVPVHPAWYLSTLGLAVLIAAVAVWRRRGGVTVTALVISVLLFGLAGYFNFVIARVPAAPSAFVVGRPAPDFTLPDAGGRQVTLSEYRGKKAVLLVFYRGYW
jgi:cytochrome oxidase Cu insertion factor (SCO1/SenC/PrrC family)